MFTGTWPNGYLVFLSPAVLGAVFNCAVPKGMFPCRTRYALSRCRRTASHMCLLLLLLLVIIITIVIIIIVTITIVIIMYEDGFAPWLAGCLPRLRREADDPHVCFGVRDNTTVLIVIVIVIVIVIIIIIIIVIVIVIVMTSPYRTNSNSNNDDNNSNNSNSSNNITANSRDSIEVRESTRVVLGNASNKWCGVLLTCLLLPSFFA